MSSDQTKKRKYDTATIVLEPPDRAIINRVISENGILSSKGTSLAIRFIVRKFDEYERKAREGR